MMGGFEIGFLDHVAILVKDMEVSAEWYGRVLGLRRLEYDEWGAYPIFMMAGKAGVALFPADINDEELSPRSKNVKIDHFAFNVDNVNFELAKAKLNRLGIPFEQKNHHFFESIYMDDPDGHCVELTTILVPESDFYRNQ